MIRRLQFLACFLGCLCVSSMAQAQHLGPTQHGRSFHVSALPAEIFMPNQYFSDDDADAYPSESTLAAHVVDINRQPVDGAPVTFALTPACKSVVTLAPQRVVTHHGVAKATVKADQTTGACRIAVRVDDVVRMVPIAVEPAPTELSNKGDISK